MHEIVHSLKDPQPTCTRLDTMLRIQAQFQLRFVLLFINYYIDISTYILLIKPGHMYVCRMPRTQK